MTAARHNPPAEPKSSSAVPLWVAKTSFAPKSLIYSDLRPRCHLLFLVRWPGPTPREQRLGKHRHKPSNWPISLGTRPPSGLSRLRDCPRLVSLGARRSFCAGTKSAAAPGRHEVIEIHTAARRVPTTGENLIRDENTGLLRYFLES